MGQASLTVYVVHVELVYGIASFAIKRKLGLVSATALWILVTVGMVYLAWWRLYRYNWRLPWPLGPGRSSSQPATKREAQQQPG